MVTTTARRVGKALPALLLGAAVAALLLLVISRLLGFQVLAVLSGSMAPTHVVGGAVFVQPLEPHDVAGLTPGDVITFVTADPDAAPITHRIVGVNPDGTFVTKGDASGGVDPDPVVPGQVRGTVVLHVPFLGYASRWLSDTVLTVRLLGVLVLLYVGTLLVPGPRGRPPADGARRVQRERGGRRSRGTAIGHLLLSTRPPSIPPPTLTSSGTEGRAPPSDDPATDDRHAHPPWWPATMLVLVVAAASTTPDATLAAWSVHDTTGGTRLMTGEWETTSAPPDHASTAPGPARPDDATNGQLPTPHVADTGEPDRPPHAEELTENQDPDPSTTGDDDGSEVPRRPPRPRASWDQGLEL
jgi:signal peptidase I